MKYRWTVFSADRERGEISKGGFTSVHGTALFHVVSFLLRGSFAENGNGFATFQLNSRLRHLIIKPSHIVVDANFVKVRFHMLRFSDLLADGIG